MKNLALITGATAGIGKATSLTLAKKGWDLIITGRRQERLDELKQMLEKEYSISVTPLCFDVSDRIACEEIFENHKDSFAGLTALVNNAGLARGVDKIQDANMADWDEMIDTNVKGLLYVTRLSLPFLQKQGAAHIVNIGSVAGRYTYPGGGVYCATKFSVRAISEGLRMDLVGSNIRVTNISPGLVETEFSKVRLKDDNKAKAVYDGMTPLTGQDIADCVAWSLDRPAHVNIQEMVIFPTEQASVRDIHRNL